MQVCFAESIKLCTKRVLNSHIMQVESRAGAKVAYRSQRELELDAAKYKDVCSTLAEENVDSCLAQSFTVLLGVLRSHDQMANWLATMQTTASKEAAAGGEVEVAAATALRELGGDAALATAPTMPSGTTLPAAGNTFDGAPPISSRAGDAARMALATEKQRSVSTMRLIALASVLTVPAVRICRVRSSRGAKRA